uniref:Uncharacterized protein n=1 Tax=Arundo donax TaxID=35708 RepID=A0A0A9BC14_ARUDO
MKNSKVIAWKIGRKNQGCNQPIWVPKDIITRLNDPKLVWVPKKT